MKLAWFSPLLPEHSDIANYTERLREDLQRSFDVRFLTEKPGGFLEPSSGTFYHAGLGPRPYDLLVSLNAADLPVYNLGNNPTYFSRTWFLNQFKPGIVILHDVKLHHFFEGIYRGQLRDEKCYLDLMEKYHGGVGREAGGAFCRSLVSISDMAEHFPMTAWAVRNALAVVVHTAYAREAVRRATNLPVFTIPLPYRSQADPKKENTARFSRDHCARLVIFGYLHTNRRVIEFLHALATMPEGDCFEVHVLGTIFHEREVRAAVGLLGLREQVTFYGHVPDEMLENTLAGADMAINLRYPTMGEASGSQLRIWDHALPSLVSASDGLRRPPAGYGLLCPARTRTRRHSAAPAAFPAASRLFPRKRSARARVAARPSSARHVRQRLAPGLRGSRGVALTPQPAMGRATARPTRRAVDRRRAVARTRAVLCRPHHGNVLMV